MKTLKFLLCGNHSGLGELSSILLHIGTTIDYFSKLSFQFLNNKRINDLPAIGPHCGRTILESSFTCLIARLDPFRLLLVRGFQTSNTYSIDTRGKQAIQWSGDILLSENPPPNIWDPKLSQKDVSRALLSPYMGEFFWKPGFIALLDSIGNNIRNPWIIELQRISPDGIVHYFRREASKLYTSLSKGVHHEFVVSPTIIYDVDTVKVLLEETITLVVKMAFISHFIPTALARITPNNAIKYLSNIEKNIGA